MSQPGNSKLRDFTQKMRSEGSAAFAAGPWDDEQQPKEPPRSTTERQRASWALRAAADRLPGKRSPRGLEDRVLAWVAIVALATFIAGVLGTYLSYKPGSGPATTRIEPSRFEPGTPVPDPARLEARLNVLEERFRELLDPLRERLQALEQQLVINSNQFEARLLELENSPPPAGEGVGVRLRQLEQKLADSTERLDELSLVLATRSAARRPGSRDTASLREVAIREPETADPVEPAPQPVAAARQINNRPAEGPLPAAQEDVKRVPAAAINETPLGGTVQRREPAPVAESPAVEQKLPDPESTSATQQPAPDPAPAMEATPRMASLPAAAPTPVQQPAEPPQDTAPAAPSGESGTGQWSINIASYTSQGIADRKLAKFRQQGVDAVQTSATVNGRTIYRVRVTGFANRREAEAEAAVIRSRLGLQETWVTKR
jgi:hypothetical protein